MNELQIKGNWNEAKGKLKQKFGALVEDESVYAEGKIDELIGIIQQKSGRTKEAIREEINDILS